MAILTVRELIEQLQQLPQEAEVYTEGCDCINRAGKAELDSVENTVLITRGGVPYVPPPEPPRQPPHPLDP
jgi:hypothetical protein